MPEFECPLLVNANTCMPKWETDLPLRCIDCIDTALRNPATRKHKIFDEANHEANEKPTVQVQIRATLGAYNRVYRVITGPPDLETGKLVPEITFYAYFNCENS